MQADDLMELFYRITNKYAAVEKKRVSFEAGTTLFTREIHTIDCIGRNPGLNLTSLAKLQGITKGAASQTVKKLSEKGFVQKQAAKGPNELHLALTEEGWRYFHLHSEMHREEYALLSSYLQQLSKKDAALLVQLFTEIDDMIDKRL